jgi:hypothetical protein
MLPALQAFASQGLRNHAAVVPLSVAVVGLVAFAACWVPARRAAREQPLVALGTQRPTPSARVMRRLRRSRAPIYGSRRAASRP